MGGQLDKDEMLLRESSSGLVADSEDFDLLLLQDSLAKTPWERMQANDDALNFGDSLRKAMQKRHAKLK